MRRWRSTAFIATLSLGRRRIRKTDAIVPFPPNRTPVSLSLSMRTAASAAALWPIVRQTASSANPVSQPPPSSVGECPRFENGERARCVGGVGDGRRRGEFLTLSPPPSQWSSFSLRGLFCLSSPRPSLQTFPFHPPPPKGARWRIGFSSP